MYVSKYNLIFDTPEPQYKILLNSLSGAMDLVDEKVVRFIRDIKEDDDLQTKEDNNLTIECLKKGYIYKDKREEDRRLMEVVEIWDEAVRRKTESITIYPTFTCNLKCIYCFESQFQKSKAEIMKKEVLLSLISAIDNIHISHGADGYPMVTIFGGEPLLRRKKQFEIIKEILEAFTKRNFPIGIITNGVELPYYCDLLHNYSVQNIEVTIDGPKEYHDQRRIFPNGRGSFDRVVEGIDAAIRKGIKTIVRVNVDKQNIDCLPELTDFILEKGWLDNGAEVDLYGIDEIGCESESHCNRPHPEILSGVFDMFKRYEKTKIFNFVHRSVKFFEDLLRCHKLPFPQISYCGATVNNKYSFDLFGNISACCCLNCCEMEEFNIGRFYPKLEFTENLRDSWKKRNILNLPKCRNCKEALLCGGGCTRIALTRGESLANGVFCPSVKEELQIAFNHYYPALKKKLLEAG